MNRILLVTGSDKSAELLRSLVNSSVEHEITVAKSDEKALALVRDGGFDVALFNAAPNEAGCAPAFKAAALGTCSVILLVGEETADILAAECERAGVFTVTKPISRRAFLQGLRLAETSHGRLSKLKSENDKLRSKLEEMKLIDRAKCILIQYLSMSEEMAHRYIEKQAMDSGMKKVKVAENILRTYEP